MVAAADLITSYLRCFFGWGVRWGRRLFQVFWSACSCLSLIFYLFSCDLWWFLPAACRLGDNHLGIFYRLCSSMFLCRVFFLRTINLCIFSQFGHNSTSLCHALVLRSIRPRIDLHQNGRISPFHAFRHSSILRHTYRHFWKKRLPVLLVYHIDSFLDIFSRRSKESSLFHASDRYMFDQRRSSICLLQICQFSSFRLFIPLWNRSIEGLYPSLPRWSRRVRRRDSQPPDADFFCVVFWSKRWYSTCGPIL